MIHVTLNKYYNAYERLEFTVWEKASTQHSITLSVNSTLMALNITLVKVPGKLK